MAHYYQSKKTAGPWVDIDLQAISQNYETIHQQTGSAETAAVVKCDAYGLGVEAVATKIANDNNCKTFFVAYPEEGAALRKILEPMVAGATIYVFNGPLPQTMALFQDAKLTPILNTVEQATRWAAKNPNIAAAIHIDTGMNRLGMRPESLEEVKTINGLAIDLVMSHLACASLTHMEKNDQQLARFNDAAAHFPNARKSLAASGGAFMDERFHFDLIRPGIALFGGSPFDEDLDELAPVASLRAPIVQTRHIEEGDSVGYGATFTATRPTTIATVALGYGDGYLRTASGKSTAFVNGSIVPIAGRISMDLITLDITDLNKPAEPGDIVEFFGTNLSLTKAANACQTIPYELLTALGGRIDRRYL